jgi:hypothetical protein
MSRIAGSSSTLWLRGFAAASPDAAAGAGLADGSTCPPLAMAAG